MISQSVGSSLFMAYSQQYISARAFIFLVLAVFLFEFSFPQIVHARAERKPLLLAQAWVGEQVRAYSSLYTPAPTVSEETSDARATLYVTVTSYSSTRDQTDDTPYITAWGTFVRDGVIAANFLPLGTRIRMPDHFGDKVFIVEDRMNDRYWRRIDIWQPSREVAKQWGIKRVRIEII